MTNSTCTHARPFIRAEYYRDDNNDRMLAIWCHGCGSEIDVMPAPQRGTPVFA